MPDALTIEVALQFENAVEVAATWMQNPYPVLKVEWSGRGTTCVIVPRVLHVAGHELTRGTIRDSMRMGRRTTYYEVEIKDA